MSNFQIFTDSSCDLDKSQRSNAKLEYFRMGVIINGKAYHADLDYQEYSIQDFYGWVGDTKNVCKTSLITTEEVESKSIPYLEQGIDVVYLATTTALTGSLNVFELAAKSLREKYPERKIVGIDTKRAGLALGLLCLDCAKMRDDGASLDEVIAYVNENNLHYNLLGTVSTLKYLKAAGRVSGASAFFGNLLSVKPVIVSDEVGNNYVVEKVKGSKKSWDRLFELTADLLDPDHKLIYLGQGMAEESASYLKQRFVNELHAEVVDYWVGPIIGLSCGPGVIHIVFRGKVAKIEKNR